MKHYSLGFLFSRHLDQVVLIRRIKADWQQGLLNGVGGQLEEGETPHECMVREFQEETGVLVLEWTKAVRLIMGEPFNCVLHIFVAVDFHNSLVTRVEDRGEGVPSRFLVCDLHRQKMVPNLKWLVPMLLQNIGDGVTLDIRQHGANISHGEIQNS